MPILGSAECGEDGSFEFNLGEPQAYIRRPAHLYGIRSAYAVYIVDESMEPRYFSGEAVYVNPTAPVRRGDFVVVEVAPSSPGDPPRAFVKRFISRDNDFLTLMQFNPPKTLRIRAKNVVHVHKIVLGGEP